MMSPDIDFCIYEEVNLYRNGTMQPQQDIGGDGSRRLQSDTQVAECQ